MHRFIGKKKPKAPVASLDEATAKMDGRIDSLDEKIAKLDAELLVYRKKLKTAKGSSAKAIKQRALGVLKRKKMYEKQRESYMAQSFNLEQTNFTLESLRNTAGQVETMKETAKTLKTQYKSINIDKVQDLQDDLADLMIDSEEIQEVMSRNYGDMDDIDDDELDDELAALDEEEFEADTGATDELPAYLSSVPTAPTGNIDTDEYGLPKAPVGLEA